MEECRTHEARNPTTGRRSVDLERSQEIGWRSSQFDLDDGTLNRHLAHFHACRSPPANRQLIKELHWTGKAVLPTEKQWTSHLQTQDSIVDVDPQERLAEVLTLLLNLPSLVVTYVFGFPPFAFTMPVVAIAHSCFYGTTLALRVVYCRKKKPAPQYGALRS